MRQVGVILDFLSVPLSPPPQYISQITNSSSFFPLLPGVVVIRFLEVRSGCWAPPFVLRNFFLFVPFCLSPHMISGPFPPLCEPLFFCFNFVHGSSEKARSKDVLL